MLTDILDLPIPKKVQIQGHFLLNILTDLKEIFPIKSLSWLVSARKLFDLDQIDWETSSDLIISNFVASDEFRHFHSWNLCLLGGGLVFKKITVSFTKTLVNFWVKNKLHIIYSVINESNHVSYKQCTKNWGYFYFI